MLIANFSWGTATMATKAQRSIKFGFCHCCGRCNGGGGGGSFALGGTATCGTASGGSASGGCASVGIAADSVSVSPLVL